MPYQSTHAVNWYECLTGNADSSSGMSALHVNNLCILLKSLITSLNIHGMLCISGLPAVGNTNAHAPASNQHKDKHQYSAKHVTKVAKAEAGHHSDLVRQASKHVTSLSSSHIRDILRSSEEALVE